MGKVADNLNAVADMIEHGKMWCKNEWSAMREIARQPIGTADRVGCAEGLLAEQMGLYNGFTAVSMFSLIEPNTKENKFLRRIGQILNFRDDEDDNEGDVDGNCYYLSELRETDEWRVLVKTIQESGVFKERHTGEVDDVNAVVVWNDGEETTEADAAMMFRKAAIAAEESA